jgi:hypothetical protein
MGCLLVDPRPKPTSTSPNSGARGSTLDVDLFGSDFQSDGKPQFGSGITVNSVAFVDSKHLVANITSWAPPRRGLAP